MVRNTKKMTYLQPFFERRIEPIISLFIKGEFSENHDIMDETIDKG